MIDMAQIRQTHTVVVIEKARDESGSDWLAGILSLMIPGVGQTLRCRWYTGIFFTLCFALECLWFGFNVWTLWFIHGSAAWHALWMRPRVYA